eukprot:CAMPEP_0118974188 /NCGR_PEP_ID=MMETSP1173-20130426/11117_1 /TAXON_ID=1034831 /ORGANISM="Rhizochromulina marina cf, Strain CCMP1243" /LENGTH=160 /DNA_ID=CAMNT_0006923897 /DNA_START=368 /DNA_END=850 /DNA_ORIENTATION=+
MAGDEGGEVLEPVCAFDGRGKEPSKGGNEGGVESEQEPMPADVAVGEEVWDGTSLQADGFHIHVRAGEERGREEWWEEPAGSEGGGGGTKKALPGLVRGKFEERLANEPLAKAETEEIGGGVVYSDEDQWEEEPEESNKDIEDRNLHLEDKEAQCEHCEG